MKTNRRLITFVRKHPVWLISVTILHVLFGLSLLIHGKQVSEEQRNPLKPSHRTHSNGKRTTHDPETFVYRAAEEAEPLNVGDAFSPTPSMRRYFQYYGLNFSSPKHYFGTFRSEPYTLAAHVFIPDKARGTTVLVHGYYDHAGVLRHLIEFLLSRKYAVCVYDHPGHGLSSGERASITDFREYAEVLEDFLAICIRDLPGPYHLVAHSMGCSITIEALQNHKTASSTDKVILLAPLIRSTLWRTAGAGETVAGLFVDSYPRVFRKNTSNRTFLDFTRKDPLQTRKVPTEWTKALRNWNDRYDLAPQIRMPMKIIQGTNDSTVHWKYNLPSLAEKIPKAQICKIPGAGHQLMNESIKLRQKVFDEIAAYLDQKPE